MWYICFAHMHSRWDCCQTYVWLRVCLVVYLVCLWVRLSVCFPFLIAALSVWLRYVMFGVFRLMVEVCPYRLRRYLGDIDVHVSLFDFCFSD